MRNPIIEFVEKEIEKYIEQSDFVEAIIVAYEYDLLEFATDLIYNTGYADGTLYRE